MRQTAQLVTEVRRLRSVLVAATEPDADLAALGPEILSVLTTPFPIETPAERGEELMRLTNLIIERLANDAVAIHWDTCRRTIFHLLADELYGNLPIEIPPFKAI